MEVSFRVFFFFLLDCGDSCAVEIEQRIHLRVLAVENGDRFKVVFASVTSVLDLLQTYVQKFFFGIICFFLTKLKTR